MKTIITFFILLLATVTISSCYTSIPLESKKSDNNSTYEISYLFEHDGCKVYRFRDEGHYVYFTTQGGVTAIKDDSTQIRTIIIKKEPIMPIKKDSLR